jgi:hypothetical protein
VQWKKVVKEKGITTVQYSFEQAKFWVNNKAKKSAESIIQIHNSLCIPTNAHGHFAQLETSVKKISEKKLKSNLACALVATDQRHKN